MLCLHAVTDQDGDPLENEDESGMRLCEYWRTIFQARIEGERHHLHETILRYVQKAPNDTRWEIDRNEFDELMAGKKNWLQALTGAGGLGSQFLYKAYKHVIEGGPIPALFAASRTVFIPKSSDVDNNGRIVGSPEALRPFTLCNCDCKILTAAICRGPQWYTMRCIHPSQRCISSKQMTDNIFEVETTAWAHVACAPRESVILLTDFAAAYSSVNHSWIFHVLEEAELLEFICRLGAPLHLISFCSTTQLPKGQPPMNYGAEALSLPDVLRDIPDETVKALVGCLVTTIFLDVTTSPIHVEVDAQQETLACGD